MPQGLFKVYNNNTLLNYHSLAVNLRTPPNEKNGFFTVTSLEIFPDDTTSKTNINLCLRFAVNAYILQRKQQTA
jgi:hypothetical protein